MLLSLCTKDSNVRNVNVKKVMLDVVGASTILAQFAAGISRVKSGYASSSLLHFDGTWQLTSLFLYLRKWVWLVSLSSRSSYYYGYMGVG